jgi:nucleoside-diphosphate-sugar epimerase
MQKSDELHVVLGASGGLGKAVVRELVKKGKKVHAANRSGTADVPNGVELVKCDAADVEQVRDICKGAAVVYHCVNAEYTNWPEAFPPINTAIIEGAASAGAKLIFGDNLYMYGPVNGLMTEDLPNNATTRKGRVRIKMADEMLDAHKSAKVRVAIGRGSDFYGPGVPASAMGERVFVPPLEGKAVNVLRKQSARPWIGFAGIISKANNCGWRIS